MESLQPAVSEKTLGHMKTTEDEQLKCLCGPGWGGGLVLGEKSLGIALKKKKKKNSELLLILHEPTQIPPSPGKPS